SLVAVAVVPRVRAFALLEAFVEFALVAEALGDVFALAVQARTAHCAAIDRAVGECHLAYARGDLASREQVGRLRRRRGSGRRRSFRSDTCRGRRGCPRGGWNRARSPRIRARS